MNKEELKEEILRISGVDTKKCMKCGKCSASCPAFDFLEYGPHKVSAMVENFEVELLFASSLNCMSCFVCAQRCPRGVKPYKIYEALRALELRKKEHDVFSDGLFIKDDTAPMQAIVTRFRKYKK